LVATGRAGPHTIAGSRPERGQTVITAGTAINEPLLGRLPVTVQLVGSQGKWRNRIDRLIFPVNIGRVPFRFFFFTRKEQSRAPRLPVPDTASRLGIIWLKLTKRIEAVVLNRLDQLLSLTFRMANGENQQNQAEENRSFKHVEGTPWKLRTFLLIVPGESVYPMFLSDPSNSV